VPSPLDRCAACGAECVAWKDAVAHELCCPRCTGRLERADLGAVHVEQCARCLGCFVRTEDFGELVEQREHGQRVEMPFVPPQGRELPRQALLALVRCPHCPREMDRARFDQRAELIVDICPSHGMWLDAGELLMVLEYIGERSSGHIAPSAAMREETAKWDRVEQTLANEARIVDTHLASATAPRPVGNAGVIVATAIGGPWLGLFVALRNRHKRK
jgi:Zn-finger nucleic acid-binding protein